MKALKQKCLNGISDLKLSSKTKLELDSFPMENVNIYIDKMAYIYVINIITDRQTCLIDR